MSNRLTLLRLPNTLRCKFTTASGILKQLEYKTDHQSINIKFIEIVRHRPEMKLPLMP
ncbi:MAG: hypothetical protein LBJ00_06700 [Planctomycetaceae bacterium]|nr:hypothetical protein [Planctomycetaceae bacterium]